MSDTVELPLDEATRVHALIDRLGLPGLIDVHTHFMPKSVLDKVWSYFDAVGSSTGREWGIAYRFDEAARVAKCGSSALPAGPASTTRTSPAWPSG